MDAAFDAGFCSEEHPDPQPEADLHEGESHEESYFMRALSAMGFGAHQAHVPAHHAEHHANAHVQTLEELRRVKGTPENPLVMKDGRLFDSGRGGKALPTTGDVAQATTKAGKIRTVGNVLGGVAVAGEMAEAAHETSAQTTVGQLTDVGDAGMMTYGTMMSPLGGLDALMGFGSAGLGYLGEKLGVETLANGGHWLGANRPTRQMVGAGRSAIQLAEGAVTGESKGMAKVHDEQVRGAYGDTLQQAAQAGDFWASGHVMDQVGYAIHELGDLRNDGRMLATLGEKALLDAVQGPDLFGPFAHYAD